MALHRAHRHTFLFENLTIQEGRGIALDLPSLERKFLDERRGGYCFEHNTLFDAVLRELGFETMVLLARVRRGSRERWVRTHMVLRVIAEGEPWLADTGFGALGLLDPMPLREGSSSVQGGCRYDLVREGAMWVLRMTDASGCSDFYEFIEDPQTPADVEAANHYTSTHPDSNFRRTLTIQRVNGEERTILRGDTLIRHRNGAPVEEKHDAAAIRPRAREVFGITLPEQPLVFETYPPRE